MNSQIMIGQSKRLTIGYLCDTIYEDYVLRIWQGVVQEAKERNVNLVCFGGFDNSDESRSIIPALTTVNQPLFEQGILGLRLLADILEGKKVDNIHRLPSELIIRRSCGCFYNLAPTNPKSDNPV